jgi:hypothetical protein
VSAAPPLSDARCEDCVNQLPAFVCRQSQVREVLLSTPMPSLGGVFPILSSSLDWGANQVPICVPHRPDSFRYAPLASALAGSYAVVLRDF